MVWLKLNESQCYASVHFVNFSIQVSIFNSLLIGSIQNNYISLQHDETLSPNEREVRQYIKNVSRRRWIGRRARFYLTVPLNGMIDYFSSVHPTKIIIWSLPVLRNNRYDYRGHIKKAFRHVTKCIPKIAWIIVLK